MVYGVLAVWTSMGWTYITLMLSHCILLYSISLVKIHWLCYVTGLCTLATFRCEPFVSWQVRRFLLFCSNVKDFPLMFSVSLLHTGRVCGGRLWAAPRSFLRRLWVYDHALHELRFGELWTKRWPLQRPRASQVQLLPPFLLFWAHHDVWQVLRSGMGTKLLQINPSCSDEEVVVQVMINKKQKQLDFYAEVEDASLPST